MEKKKILMIDDDVDFTDLVKTTIEETGRYQVQVENRSSLGHHAAKTFKPDLILLDVSMPDMDGSEVAEQIRDDKDIKNTPVVFLTSIVNEEEVDSSSGMIGGWRFISKTQSVRKILDSIEQIISS
jgi:CheY-like chemotaxis protein